MSDDRVWIRRRQLEEVGGYLAGLEWLLRRRQLSDETLAEWIRSADDEHLVMEPLRYGNDGDGPGLVADNIRGLRRSLGDAAAIAHLEEHMDDDLAADMAEDIGLLTAALQTCIESVQQLGEQSLPRGQRARLENHWNVLASISRRYRKDDEQ